MEALQTIAADQQGWLDLKHDLVEAAEASQSVDRDTKDSLVKLLCVVWILPLLIKIAECQRCQICGPEQEGGACRPNKIMNVPENITINDGMCTAIESTGYHKDVLCKEYKAPNGYFFQCLDSTNSQFSCRSTCGPSLDSIGTGPEFDLLNQNGGLLLGKGANKRGLLDFSNFQNGGGFGFGQGNTGRNPFGQGDVNPRTRVETNRGSGAFASASSANKENNKKSSSSTGNGNQDLFNKDLFGDLGFNSFYPKKQSTQNGQNTNVDNSNFNPVPGNELNQDSGNVQSGTAFENSRNQNQPLKVSLHKERDTDNIVVPIDSRVKDSTPGNPEKVELVKIPNLDLKVNPSNLVVEPAPAEQDLPPTDETESTLPDQKQPIQKEEGPRSPVPNDPYSRYPKPTSQNQAPSPPENNFQPQGIAVGEPYNIDLKPQDSPSPIKPPATEQRGPPGPYQSPDANKRGREFERQQPPQPPPTQGKFNTNNDDRYSNSPYPNTAFRPQNYPSPPPSTNNLPPVDSNRPQYPQQDPPQNQPPRRFSPYPDPTYNPPEPSTPRNSNFRDPNPQTPQRNYNVPPKEFDVNSNPRNNNLPDRRGSINAPPTSRQPNAQRQDPYGTNEGNSYDGRYDDRYPKTPEYTNSNSNNGRGNGGLGEGSGVKSPEGLDGSRLRGEDGGLGKSVDFAGTSLLADSDYLDKPADGNRYKTKVPEEFEKPFQAENDIFPGFSNFANGDKSGFGTGKSVFNLFDGKGSDPPGFKNGQFNFNNKDFLKPDSHNKENDRGRGDNPNAPTSSPSRFNPGPQTSPPRDAYATRPQTSDNRNPNSFRPNFQPSPQPNPNESPSRSRYPDDGRNDLIRQNERRNPTYFDPSSSPTSNRPFLTAPNQQNPSSNEQRPPYPPRNNNYNPNDNYNRPNAQNQPPRNNYPSPPSNPQNAQYPPPQRNEDNSPPFNTNLRSPLNLFGGSLPFQSNPDSRPTQPGQSNPPQPDYRNPQPASPQNPNFLGGNPYSNQPSGNPYSNQRPGNPPYAPTNPSRFQGSGRFPPSPEFGGPGGDRQQPPFQQHQPQNTQQPQPGSGQFQNPGSPFQPASFPPLFDNDNDDNNNNFDPNLGPAGQNKFAPPSQPSQSNDFPFPGDRGQQTVPNIHINNFLSSQPSGNQYNNPQGGPNNRPGPPGPSSNAAPYSRFNNNQIPTNNRENPNTQYDVRSPTQSQPGLPNFELDFKPINQPSNSRPDSFFSQPSQNSRPFDPRPPSQPPQQQPAYSGPPNSERGGGDPFTFGGVRSPPRPSPPYQSPNPGNDGNRTPFSFDGPSRAAPPTSYDQPRPTNDRIGRPFSFDGPGRGLPPQNQPPTNDRIGSGPFSFGNRNPSPNAPQPSTYDPSRSPYDRSGEPFSFGNGRGPSQSFTPNRPPTDRDNNNPFSFENNGGPSQPASPFNQAPPPRANIDAPNYVVPTPTGNRYGAPYAPNQGGLPSAGFQQGATGNLPQSRPTVRGENSGLTPNALLDSSPFTFEDPTGSDQSVPSFGLKKPAPPQSQPDVRSGFGGGFSYGPPDRSGNPAFVPAGAPGVQGGTYPQPGPPNIYPSPQGRPEYNTVQAAGGNSPFSQRNPNEFGFDSNFGQFGDTNTQFKEGFTSDRFSDPEGYFGDGAFTDDTTQEETNETSNYDNSSD